jgi:hypothetical protein
VNIILKGEDFFRFSCGSFLTNKRIPGDKAYVDDSFSVLTNNLNDAILGKLLYQILSFVY